MVLVLHMAFCFYIPNIVCGPLIIKSDLESVLPEHFFV